MGQDLRKRLSRGEAAILACLEDHGSKGLGHGASIREIVEAVGAAKEVVQYHLYRKHGRSGPRTPGRLSLQERGLVRRDTWGGIQRFRITAKGKRVLEASRW